MFDVWGLAPRVSRERERQKLEREDEQRRCFGFAVENLKHVVAAVSRLSSKRVYKADTCKTRGT